MAQPDGHDAPRLIDEAIPGEAAMVEDVGVGCEDAVREPVVAHELPHVLDRVELGAFRRQRQQGDVGGHDKRAGAMPSGPIEEQHGMSARRDGGRDFRQMQGHAFGIAPRQHECCALTLGRADRTVDIG